MSVSTHLRILSDFRQWADAGQPIHALLDIVQSYVQDVVSDAKALRFYLLEDHSLVPYAATTDDTPEAQNVNQAYSQALTLRKPVFDETQTVWIIPLNCTFTAVSILEISLSAPTTDDQSQETAEWLELMGLYVSQTLDHYEIHQHNVGIDTDAIGIITDTAAIGDTTAISERQKSTFAEMVVGQTLGTTVDIVARHMLPDNGHFLAVNAFDLNEQNSIIAWHTVESSNVQNLEQRKYNLTIEWDDLPEKVRQKLEDGESIEFSDLNSVNVSEIGDKFHRWLVNHHMKSAFLVPVMSNTTPLAILTFMSLQANIFSFQLKNALSNIADQIGTITHSRELITQTREARNTIDNLALASRLVIVASDYPNMAEAVTYTLAREQRGVSLTLFDHVLGEGDLPEYRTFVGLATPQKSISVDSSQTYADLPHKDQLAQLRHGQLLIIDNFKSGSNYLSADSLALLDELKPTWMVAVGLRHSNHLIGVMEIYNDRPVSLSQYEQEGLTTLADLIAMNIRSRQLLETSQRAEMTANQLVQTNTVIASALGYDEIASAIVAMMPETVGLVSLLIFDEPVMLGMIPGHLKFAALATRETSETPDVVDYFKGDGSNPTAISTLKSFMEEEILIIDDMQAQRENVAIPNILDHLIERGFNSVLAVPLSVGGRLLGILAFCSTQKASFANSQHDTLRAIAGQISIIMENRELLNETTDALSFVAAQYEMNNALFRAKTAQEMLNILHRFLEGAYSQGQIGLVDENERVRVIANIDAETNTNDYEEELTLFSYQLPQDLHSSTDVAVISDNKQEITLPMLSTENEKIFGVIKFTHHSPVDVPANQVRALRNLVDQVSIMLQNKMLLQTTDRSLKETLSLYEVSRAISGSSDGIQLMEQLQKTTATDASTLTLSHIAYDIISDQVKSIRLLNEVSADKSETVNEDLTHFLKASEAEEQFIAQWAEHGEEVLFIESVKEEHVKIDPIIAYYQSRWDEFGSIVVMPVFEDGQLIELLHIMYPSARLFTDAERVMMSAIRDQVSTVLRNHRLLLDIRSSAAQLGSQVRILQTLNRFTSNIISIQKETTLLEEATQTMVNVVGVSHSGVTILNQDGRSSTVVAEYPDQGLVGIVISADNPLQRQIINEQAPITLNKLAENTDLEPAARDALVGLGLKSMALLPLVDANQRYLGSIGLDVYEENIVITPDMMSLARAITSQTVIALQNIRQLENTEKQANQLQELAHFSQVLQAELDIDVILNTVINRASRFLPADIINLYVASTQDQAIWLMIQREDDSIVHKQKSPVKFEETMIAHAAWSNKELVNSYDFEKDGVTLSTSPEIYKSGMIAPYFSRGIAIGMIEIGSKSAYGFGDTDQILFAQMVNQVGIAIENADAYIQSQRIAQSKALVNDISTQLQQQIDIDSILNITIHELGRALGAKSGRIRLGNLDNGKE